MQKRAGFDWLALAVALIISAFFALTARFNSIPAASFVPAAVLSATGCGLLVTAVHKLRGRGGVGLWEAGLAGLFLALSQFLIGLTYPALFSVLHTTPRYTPLIFLTWGLVGFFAILLSLLGATLGHLTFAPLRPLPVQTNSRARSMERADEEEIDEQENALEENGVAFAIAPKGEKAATVVAEHEMTQENAATETEEAREEESEEKISDDEREDEALEEQVDSDEQENEEREEKIGNDEQEEEKEEGRPAGEPRNALINYIIGVLLLGLLPMMAGYVFAAAYDFVLNANNAEQIFPAFYPTLSLLGSLLPWQIVLHLNVVNEAFTVFTHLWRIPNALGNPAIFDVQALEPLLLNAAALALLLLTMYKRESQESTRRTAPWGVFLGLEALLGLLIVLAPNLWLMRGLEGVLQFSTLAFQLPTISLLNPMLFTLNLATGILFCVLVGLIVRRQYQLWTLPRKQVDEE